ncbi:MAG: hypothetical protein H6701_05510 [Myxococcales bacterium]|nr:hypothetical protein [Myxococcales bacterium]
MESSRDRFRRLIPRFVLAALLFSRTRVKQRVFDLAEHVFTALEGLPDCPSPSEVAAVTPRLATDLAFGLQDVAEALCAVAPDLEATEEHRFVQAVAELVLPGMNRAMCDALDRLDAAGAEVQETGPVDGDTLGGLLVGALEAPTAELGRLMRAFGVDNDDDEVADDDPADDDPTTNYPAPGCLTPRDALGVLDGDDQAVRMYLAAQLSDAGIDPDDIFEDEGLGDIELTPLLYCADDDELLERVDELRAELRVAL